MPNVLQDSGRQYFADEWLVDVFKLVLLKPTYPYNEAHDFLADIDTDDRLATSPALTGKSNDGGYCASDEVTVAAVGPSGEVLNYLWLFRDTGTAATSTLVCFYDTDAANAPISVVANEGAILIRPHDNGWFRI